MLARPVADDRSGSALRNSEASRHGDRALPEMRPRGSPVCGYCTIRVDGSGSPCHASYCPSRVQLCRFCGTRLWTQDRLDIKAQTSSASIVGVRLPLFRFRPRSATFNKYGIMARTPACFGVTRSTGALPSGKEAGFQHLVRDAITIAPR